MITTELEGVVRPKIDTEGVVQGEQADESEGKLMAMDLSQQICTSAIKVF